MWNVTTMIETALLVPTCGVIRLSLPLLGFSFFSPRYGAALCVSRGGERHKEIRRLRVRGDLPCRRGRAVAVDHLPMAMKESYTIRTDSRLPTGLASLAASLAGVGGGRFYF